MYFPRKILKPEVDVNTYYYYCRCCCCRWWHLLLGLLVLQPSISSLLQSATSVITKCDRYYKVWQFYYIVRQVLQSATIITKCDSTHSDKQSLGFLNKDPRNQVSLNYSGLLQAATCTRRWASFLNCLREE